MRNLKIYLLIHQTRYEYGFTDLDLTEGTIILHFFKYNSNKKIIVCKEEGNNHRFFLLKEKKNILKNIYSFINPSKEFNYNMWLNKKEILDFFKKKIEENNEDGLCDNFCFLSYQVSYLIKSKIYKSDGVRSGKYFGKYSMLMIMMMLMSMSFTEACRKLRKKRANTT